MKVTNQKRILAALALLIFVFAVAYFWPKQKSNEQNTNCFAIRILKLIILLCGMTCVNATAQKYSIQSMPPKYVTALEDSLIILKALRPAYESLRRSNDLLRQEHETRNKEYIFRETAAILEKDNAETKLTAAIKTGRREKIKSGLIGFGLGVIAAALLL